MANKVDICGINTSTLPKLKAKEIAELMKKQKQGDQEARKMFIYSNMRLVLSVVQRFTTKKDNVDDILLYNFLEDQAKIIGKSAYIKSLLKEKLEQEQEKDNK